MEKKKLLLSGMYTGTLKRQLVTSIKILNPFIAAEHPQTVAFLMTKMNPEQAGNVLQSMSDEMQTDILIRISNLNNVKGDVVDEVREVLAKKIESEAQNRSDFIRKSSLALRSLGLQGINCEDANYIIGEYLYNKEQLSYCEKRLSMLKELDCMLDD